MKKGAEWRSLLVLIAMIAGLVAGLNAVAITVAGPIQTLESLNPVGVVPWDSTRVLRCSESYTITPKGQAGPFLGVMLLRVDVDREDRITPFSLINFQPVIFWLREDAVAGIVYVDEPQSGVEIWAAPGCTLK